MGNRQQFESVLLHIMFNLIWNTCNFLFDLFVNINYSFLFVIFFIYSFTAIYTSRTNISLFLNIFSFLFVATVFIFTCNLGPFAGFLFLCETVSLFSIFVIVGRSFNYEYSYLLYKHETTILYTLVVQVLLFSLFVLFRGEVELYSLSYYQFDALTTNDFLTPLYLFYTNNYQVFSMISILLIVVTLLIAVAIINYLLQKSYATSTFKQYKPLFDMYLMLNNSINTRSFNFLNFFKKSCLTLSLSLN